VTNRRFRDAATISAEVARLLMRRGTPPAPSNNASTAPPLEHRSVGGPGGSEANPEVVAGLVEGQRPEAGDGRDLRLTRSRGHWVSRIEEETDTGLGGEVGDLLYFDLPTRDDRDKEGPSYIDSDGEFFLEVDR
jgi:hypothetical protein